MSEIITLDNVLTDIRGKPIHTKQTKEGTVTYAGNHAIRIVPNDASEKQTSILGPNGQPIMEKKYDNGSSLVEEGIDGKVINHFGFTPNENYKKPEKVEVHRRNYSFKDIVDAVKDAIYVVAQNKGKIAAGVGIVAMLNYAEPAKATVNPLDDVHDSTPIVSFAKPTGYGNLTGADGDVSSTVWYATTTDGFILAFDGMNSTPVSVIEPAITGLTGIAYKGNNQFALSAGKNIYEGFLSGNTWNPTNGPTGMLVTGIISDLTDIDFALGNYFIATQNDGIRKVLGNGSTTPIYSPNVEALDIIKFTQEALNEKYTNNMIQLDGEIFKNIDGSGIPLGGVGNDALVNWNNSTTIRGVAYFDGGVAVVQNPGVHIHGEQAYQPYIDTVPEPATIALLGLGSLALIGSGYKKSESGLFVPKDMKE